MRIWFRAPLALALVVLSWSHLSAQAPAKPQFLDPLPQLDSKTNTAARAYLKGGGAADANGAAAVPIVAKYYMASFTETYDTKIPKFQSVRAQISELLSYNSSSEARGVLVKELQTIATSYVGRNDLLPAARVNAIYVLGELDEARDPKTSARTPYQRATGTLVTVVSTANLPTYMKVAGLSALERHVRDGYKTWPDAIKGRVRSVVLPFAVTKPKNDNERQVNTWMARRALDILKAMDANDAVDAALGYLADPKEMPSLRTSSLEYLVTRDFAKLDASQRKLYALGLVHYLRTQSTDWYQLEGDKSKRKGGAMGMGGDGGMGGSGGGMGGMGGGGMGSGFGGEGGDGGGLGGGEGSGGSLYGGMGGGLGGGEGGANKPKAKDVQDWQTRSARNHLNEFTQLVHRALDGKRTTSEPANTASKLHLTKEDVVFEEDLKLAKLIQLVDDYQKVINDIGKVRTVSALMTNSKKPIEEIMDYSKKMPGFLEKYPELKSDEDKLQEAEQPKPEEGNKPEDGKGEDGKGDDGKKDGGTGKPGDGGAPKQ